MDIVINNGIVKKCILTFEPGTNLIFGRNNVGKTSLMVLIDSFCDKHIRDSDFTYKYSLMIPTDRVVRDDASSRNWRQIEESEFISIKKRASRYTIDEKGTINNCCDSKFMAFLTDIRGQLLKNNSVKNLLVEIIRKLFKIKFDEEKKYSDGVENAINIYISIIWLALVSKHAENIKRINKDELFSMLKTSKIVVLIDEIDAYLHLSIISDFLVGLQKLFLEAILIYTTHSPIVLSRIDAKRKYEILNDKRIKLIEENLFYKSTDKISEINFDVSPWPNDVESAMIYIDKSVRKKIELDEIELKNKLDLINKYENIKHDYNGLINMANYMLEKRNGNIKKRNKKTKIVGTDQ